MASTPTSTSVRVTPRGLHVTSDRHLDHILRRMAHPGEHRALEHFTEATLRALVIRAAERLS